MCVPNSEPKGVMRDFSALPAISCMFRARETLLPSEPTGTAAQAPYHNQPEGTIPFSNETTERGATC